jgi:hypothetical protein
MNNLSNKLQAIKDVTDEIFDKDLQETYVISIWDSRITFSSEYKLGIAARAMKMDGVTSEINTAGFTTITFKHFDLTIEIVLS